MHAFRQSRTTSEVLLMHLLIIMAVYNGEPFLSEAMDSILKQTFTDFELVVVDDGSTDKTPDILASYRNKDKRIVVVRQPNSGLARSLNYAMTVARGEYVVRMDADGCVPQNRLERQLSVLLAH